MGFPSDDLDDNPIEINEGKKGELARKKKHPSGITMRDSKSFPFFFLEEKLAGFDDRRMSLETNQASGGGAQVNKAKESVDVNPHAIRSVYAWRGVSISSK